jgi:hypothetical protein
VVRHVVRGTGTECLDALLRWARLEFVDQELDRAAQVGAGVWVLLAGERAWLSHRRPVLALLRRGPVACRRRSCCP